MGYNEYHFVQAYGWNISISLKIHFWGSKRCSVKYFDWILQVQCFVSYQWIPSTELQSHTCFHTSVPRPVKKFGLLLCQNWFLINAFRVWLVFFFLLLALMARKSITNECSLLTELEGRITGSFTRKLSRSINVFFLGFCHFHVPVSVIMSSTLKTQYGKALMNESEC